MSEFVAGYNSQLLNKSYFGYFIEGGYYYRNFEPMLRYGSFTGDYFIVDSQRAKRFENFTIGFNYYFGEKIKLQTNYVLRLENNGTIENNISNDFFMLSFQYIFL